MSGYRIESRDGCTLVFGQISLDESASLMAKGRKGEVFSGSLAKAIGCKLAWGMPNEIEALKEKLALNSLAGDDESPEIVHLGKWLTNSDGITEFRTVVGLVDGQLMAGVEQSQNGGEGFITWAEETSADLAQAIANSDILLGTVLADHDEPAAVQKPKFS